MGVVSAQPDMVQMNVSLSHTAQTTKQAQEEVNSMVRKVLEILKGEEIEDKNIRTASLRFSSEYDWNSGRQLFIGQKVEQIISFSVHDIQKNNEKVVRILDNITRVNTIALNQVTFSIKDSSELFIKSRELAYQKAYDKAAQYANLAGLKVVKVLSISELGNPHIASTNNMLYNQRNYSGAIEDSSGSTVLPTGELEITSQISAVFLLE
jgi:uncharacterized protein YggE